MAGPPPVGTPLLPAGCTSQSIMLSALSPLAIVAGLLHARPYRPAPGWPAGQPWRNPNRIPRCIDEAVGYTYGRFTEKQSSLASPVAFTNSWQSWLGLVALRFFIKASNRRRRRRLQFGRWRPNPMSTAVGPRQFLVKLAIAAVGGRSTDGWGRPNSMSSSLGFWPFGQNRSN